MVRQSFAPAGPGLELPSTAYGLLFNVAGGDVVNVFSNGYGTGVLPPGLPVFGAAVVDPDNNLQAYVGAGISAPEPSTWAMLLVGFAGTSASRARGRFGAPPERFAA